MERRGDFLPYNKSHILGPSGHFPPYKSPVIENEITKTTCSVSLASLDTLVLCWVLYFKIFKYKIFSLLWSTGRSDSCLLAFGGSHSEFSRTQRVWQCFHWAKDIDHNKQHGPLCYCGVNKFKFQLLNFQILTQGPANQTFAHQVSHLFHQGCQHFLAHFVSSAPKPSLENISPAFFKPRYTALPNQAWLPLKSPYSVAFLNSMRKTALFP